MDNSDNEDFLQKIITLANDVYHSLGPGYNEVVYHRAFEVALRTHSLNYQSEVIVPILYKSHTVGHGRIDLIVESRIIIELKAVNNFNNDSVIQIKNYMKFYSITQGFVINFGQKSGVLDIKYIFGENIFNFVNGAFN